MVVSDIQIPIQILEDDYEYRRDHLLKMMRKQNIAWEREDKNKVEDDNPKKPKGKKPAPSKRIINNDIKKPRRYTWFD